MYNFDQLLEQAKQVKESQGPSGPPLVYPKVGKIQFRLLFNPKANIASRLINRHKFESNQIPCLKTYNMQCPICDTISNIQNVSGASMSRLKSVVRGISYAQYVSSSYDITDSSGKSLGLKPGDLILLMYPWTVYTAIQDIIVSVGSSPTGLADLFTKPTFNPFEITRSSDNNRTQYTVNTPPVGIQVLPDYDTQEKFDELLESLPDLSNAILPSEASNKIITQAKDTALQLERTYLNVQTPQVQQPQVASAPLSNTQNYDVQALGQAIATDSNEFDITDMTPSMTQTPSSTPQCFGSHKPNDNKCLLCPQEVVCAQATSK